MDFQFDATADGRRLKFLKVIDEHSRLCLANRVGRRCKANDVVEVLEELTSLYPAPALIRSDNAPEFIAHTLKRWSENSGSTTAYIEPGSPWQNGFAESFNSRFRVEFLNTKLFTTVAEAQALADRWRWEYNTQELRSTASTGPTRPSRGVRPWRQLNQLLHNHPLSLRLDQ
jgi:transposase InsO family protein